MTGQLSDRSAGASVFVPIALEAGEARAAANACAAVFHELTALGKASEVPELARAMYKIAKAYDERMDEAKQQEPQS